MKSNINEFDFAQSAEWLRAWPQVKRTKTNTRTSPVAGVKRMRWPRRWNPGKGSTVNTSTQTQTRSKTTKTRWGNRTSSLVVTLTHFFKKEADTATPRHIFSSTRDWNFRAKIFPIQVFFIFAMQYQLVAFA